MSRDGHVINYYKIKPLTFVIFGARGDLATRRIFPALLDLACSERLPQTYTIVGIDQEELSNQTFQAQTQNFLAKHSGADSALIQEFAAHVTYISGSITSNRVYARLKSLLLPDANVIFYLACPPDLFDSAAKNIATYGFAGKHCKYRGFHRLIIEKPFGTNLARARKLNELLHSYYNEKDIYRIDHYLGKDAVQNLMYFRFSNTVFEPLWNRHYIEKVEINVEESDGIGNRGAYYDSVGASRDMLQNHLLQLLCLTAMEPPDALAPDHIRNNKIEVLKAVEIPRHSVLAPSCIRGQYIAPCRHEGTIQGQALSITREVKLLSYNPDMPSHAYTKEHDVHPESYTETFIAVKAYIKNMRWKDVPFLLKTGKALEKRCAEIVIHFKTCPIEVPGGKPGANKLILRIQPDEGIRLRFNTWNDEEYLLEQDELVSTMRNSSGTASDPYERLLYNAIIGDSSLFIRFDETEEAWRIMEPILKIIQDDKHRNLEYYPAGSKGPDLTLLHKEAAASAHILDVCNQ